MFISTPINFKQVIKWGVLGSLGEIIYVVGFSYIGFWISFFTPSEFMGYTIILLLFVFSVGISSLFVFCYPVYLALQKRYLEAIITCLITLAILILAILVILIIVTTFLK
jgi:hypothetical protein